MKTFKKYYAHFIFLGFILFGLTGAYFSTPMLPDVETHFKSTTIFEDYHPYHQPEIKPPVNKDLRNI